MRPIASEGRRTHPPAGGDGGVGIPGGAVPVLGHAVQADLGEAVVDVAAHGELVLVVGGVQIDQARDHVRREGHDERLVEKNRDRQH